MFGIPVVLKDGSPRFMNFGLSLRTEITMFTRLLGSKSVMISPGRLFTPICSMQKQFKFLSWAADPSTEVFNGLMSLDYLLKLELLPRLGLKTYMLTPGVLWIDLLGVWTDILSTCALFHAASVTISLTLITWSSFKLSSERPSHDVSRTLVTRSCPMMAGSKRIGLIDNF